MVTEDYWPVVLAVAQWRRSPAVTRAAILRLRGQGLSEGEILACRRAATPLLRLAVTTVIARGELTFADRRFIERYALAPDLERVREYAGDANALIDATSACGGAAIDMDVGDY